MAATKRCGREGCERPPTTRGYCESDYRKRIRKGMYGYRDAAAVVEHIEKLRALGWTWEQIADAAGTALRTALDLASGRYRRVNADSERALLSVPLTMVDSHRSVDSCGTRRRVQALSWMGWPTREVARRAGIPAATLRTLILPSRQISYRYTHRVRDVYDALSHLEGPSRQAAGKARSLGFAPPAAWDDDTIDNPRARPGGIRKSA